MSKQLSTLKDLFSIKPGDVSGLTKMQLTMAMLVHPERSKVGRAIESEWDRRRTNRIPAPRDRASDIALYNEAMAKLKVM